MLILSIFFFLICSGAAFDVEQDFKYCNAYNKPLWNEKFNCNPNSLENLNGKAVEFSVLNKKHNIVSGSGFRCSINKLTHTFNENFLGENEQIIVTRTVVKVSREQCLNMIHKSSCLENKTKCIGSTCQYIPEIPIEYK